jgi:hypothetical protein
MSTSTDLNCFARVNQMSLVLDMKGTIRRRVLYAMWIEYYEIMGSQVVCGRGNVVQDAIAESNDVKRE